MTILQFVLIAFVGIIIILAGFFHRQFDKKAGLYMIYPFDSGIGLMVGGAVLLIGLCVRNVFLGINCDQRQLYATAVFCFLQKKIEHILTFHTRGVR